MVIIIKLIQLIMTIIKTTTTIEVKVMKVLIGIMKTKRKGMVMTTITTAIIMLIMVNVFITMIPMITETKPIIEL